VKMDRQAAQRSETALLSHLCVESVLARQRTVMDAFVVYKELGLVGTVNVVRMEHALKLAFGAQFCDVLIGPLIVQGRYEKGGEGSTVGATKEIMNL
jgi:hypothetical protein